MVEILYKYLVGSLFLGLIWLLFFLRYKNLRKEMLFGSCIYPLVLVPLFLITKGLSYFIELSWNYVPSYFNPDTLFNLSRILGGLSIEDVLFMLFMGGIIAVIYERLFKRRIKKSKKEPHKSAIIIFFISYIIIAIIFAFNPLYNLIISSFVGFLIIAWQRRDLIPHSIYGSLSFGIIYTILIAIFVIIFPDAITNFWYPANSSISNITIFNFPVEEVLYAFSFGLMWAPMYEYFKGYEIR